MLDSADLLQLLAQAKASAQFAYAPYSQFCVGAALLCIDGTVITGVNVENTSYGLTLCAERVAINAAIAKGFREFKAIAIWAAPQSELNHRDTCGHVLPCGACLQVMAEFFAPDTPIITAASKDARNRSSHQMTLAELLPRAFQL